MSELPISVIKTENLKITQKIGKRFVDLGSLITIFENGSKKYFFFDVL